jgi:triacylglycerol lipase
MVAIALALLTASACTASNEDTCTSLRGALKRCGLPVVALDCGRIERTTEEALMSRLGSEGCKGVAAGDSSAVDPRLCALGNWPCPLPPTPQPTTAKTKYPVVFVSGIDGSTTFDWHPKVIEALKRSGTEVFHVHVLPWATTAERADDLWLSLQNLRSKSGVTKFNLVAYAVGGLDVRYLASPNGLMRTRAAEYERVHSAIASITTIATPHRGTRVAEAALSAVRSGTTSDLLATFVGTLAEGTNTVPPDANLIRTLSGLTLQATFALNETLTDAPNTYYQSWAGVSHVLGKTSTASESAIRAACVGEAGDLRFSRHKDSRDVMNELLWVSAPFSGTSLDAKGMAIQSPSDGMVAVESAKWGNFRGCLPADHYDVIGQIGHTTRDPQTGFDAPFFYQYVASDLAGRGL